MSYTFQCVFLQANIQRDMDKVDNIMKRWNALLPLSERDRELLSRRFTYAQPDITILSLSEQVKSRNPVRHKHSFNPIF